VYIQLPNSLKKNMLNNRFISCLPTDIYIKFQYQTACIKIMHALLTASVLIMDY